MVLEPRRFPALLREHRLARALTQEALAERAGLSVRAIQNLERGDRRPYAETTARLVAALALQAETRLAFEAAARPLPRGTAKGPGAAGRGGRLANNLPSALTGCVGRETELANVARSLATARLVSLIGPGGAGKTRLALQVGLDIVDDDQFRGVFGDGVWLAELDALNDPHLVPVSVAARLGVREEADRPLDATLVDALQGRHLLLVLDNCEHLLAACGRFIENLLRSCPFVRVLATSRQPLGLAGEVVRPIPPLAVPRDDVDPDDLGRFAAVQLFLERARAAVPGFDLAPHNARQVAAICRRLDGLPLALELAAARLRALSPDDLAANLVEGFGLLRAGGQAQPRQQSLKAAIEWSYDLLDSTQRTLLRQLSVFAGGWTLAAAQAVCGAPAVDGLWQLVDRSLVQVDWRDPIQPRYRLLETVRQYAAEQLEVEDEALALRDAHLAHYVGLAEAAESALDGPDQVGWLRRLDAEQANLRAALGWADTQGDAERGLRLAAALGGHWLVRGERTEGLIWLEAGLRRGAAASPTARARALWAAGRLAQAMRNEQATLWLEESLALSRLSGDRVAVVRTLVHLGGVWLDRDHVDRARAALEEARTLAELDGYQAGVASALDLLGLAAVDQGDYALGLPMLEGSLDLFRASGDQIGLVTAQRHLAMARLEIGDAAGARQPMEEVLLVLEDLGDAVGVAWARHDLGRVVLECGDAAAAAALFDASLRQFRRLGHTSGVAWSIHNLGRARLELGDTQGAWALFREGLTLFQRLGHARGTGWALYNLAWIASDRSDADQAWVTLGDGLRCFQAQQYMPGTSACLIVAARLVLETKDDAPHAAYWLGASAAVSPGEPAAADRARAERVASAVRKRLGGLHFDAHRASGQQLSTAELKLQLDRLFSIGPLSESQPAPSGKR